MQKTEHLNLNQWEPTDPIRREDFNADNAAIDAALNTKAQVAIGSYHGAGTFGVDNPNTLTFDFPPKIILITNDGYAPMLIFSGSNSAAVQIDGGSVTLQTVSWSENGKTVSWYNNVNAKKQLNYGSLDYPYFALG